MSAVHDQARMQTLRRVLIAAAIIWLLVIGQALTAPRSSESHALKGERVLPNFAKERAETSEIRFTMADETYTLERTARGWIAPQSGGFPVRADRLSDFVTGLETLTYGDKRTSDPYKLNQIGLGEPGEGGNGVIVELFGADKTLTDAILLGRKGDTLYGRRPGDNQTYRLSGELPAFYSRRPWLDLDVIAIEPSTVAAVRLIDQTGERLYLKRPPGADTRSFVPAAPDTGRTLISRLAASTTALAVTRINPLDVMPAADLSTLPVARHVSETFDGLEVDIAAYREAEGTWITLYVVEAGRGARRAETINKKAEGWAFKLSEYDWQDFTPLVSSLVEPADASP
ncbi:MAG: DUF4340 domain-containing protein [Pseudomonadota bacterium]